MNQQEVLVKTINNLSNQIAQLSTDKAILMAENEMLKELIAQLQGEQEQK
jgi:hypothetical protein